MVQYAGYYAMNEVHEALEASAVNSSTSMFGRVSADRRDILNWRNRLMRFLEEVDGGLSVAEVREMLEAYE